MSEELDTTKTAPATGGAPGPDVVATVDGPTEDSQSAEGPPVTQPAVETETPEREGRVVVLPIALERTLLNVAPSGGAVGWTALIAVPRDKLATFSDRQVLAEDDAVIAVAPAGNLLIAGSGAAIRMFFRPRGVAVDPGSEQRVSRALSLLTSLQATAAALTRAGAEAAETASPLVPSESGAPDSGTT